MDPSRIYRKSFILPSFAIYTTLFIIPTIMGFALSLTNWNEMSDRIRYVGLSNFTDIFVTPGNDYLVYIWNTVVFAVVTSLLEAAMGLGLALLLLGGGKVRNAYRMIFFIPNAIAPLIIGLIFTSILAPNGIVNAALRLFAGDSLTHSWLTDRNFAFPSVMAVELWRRVGFNMVIFIAALQMIPKSYYEAADMDGAGRWRKLVAITIPFIMPSVTINMVFNAINGLKVFDVVFALTNGGPGDKTEVINTSVYREYSAGHWGLSTALGVITFVMTVTASILLQRTLSKREIEA
jgi:raffinose/stachyose/melibiose transport system permease protein